MAMGCHETTMPTKLAVAAFSICSSSACITWIGRRCMARASSKLDSCAHRNRTRTKNEKCGEFQLDLDQLVEQGCSRTDYAHLLRQCGSSKALSAGKRLHAHMAAAGYDRDTFLGNFIVQMYGNCGSMADASVAFQKIREQNVFSWCILLLAYAQNGHLDGAKVTFHKMPQHNVVTWNAIVTVYARKGYVEEAWFLFEEMPERNVVSWNSMISAYAQHVHLERGRSKQKKFQLFRRMDLEGMHADKITFLCLLDGLEDLETGKLIHSSAVERELEFDVPVATALVNMYGKCGDLVSARSLFDRMPERNVMSWNTMVTAYAQNGQFQEGRNLFDKMPQRDVVSCNVLITAYTEDGHLQDARDLFDSISEPSMVSWTVMVGAYAQNGQLEEARSIFDKVPAPNVVLWTAMIASYVQNGRGKEALELFRMMDLDGVQPNHVTFTTVLDACASLAALQEGKLIHSQIVDPRHKVDAGVVTGLIHMYGKCGNLSYARSMFDGLLQKTRILWTTMISAYAQCGHGREALELYREMSMEGVIPDIVTFVSILSACSHSGLRNDAALFFNSIDDNHLAPMLDHFNCMIDLLGRAGKLDEAEELINNMPVEPDSVTWISFLSACRMHADVQRGAHAADRIFELNPGPESAPYALLRNMYAAGEDSLCMEN